MLITPDAGVDWQPLRGDWLIDEGDLVPGEGPTHVIIARPGPELGRRFEIEAELTIAAPGGGYCGIAFNIDDLGDGTQNAYVVGIGAGPGAGWGLVELTGSTGFIAPASGPLDLEPGRPYTLRVTAVGYGHFGITVIDDGDVVLSEDVGINPFRQQLSGGRVGAYCGRGGIPARFGSLSYRTTSERGKPPTYVPQPLVCTPLSGPGYRPIENPQRVISASTVDQTQAQVGVTQTLVTEGDTQHVAYYAADGRMTVAQRRLGTDGWIRQPLDNTLVIDNHNEVTCALDRDGHLHVAGNMHASPLIYYRTTTAGDIASLTRVPIMTDPARERSSTYPRFLHNGEGALVYNYRSGSSGNGSTYYNLYDEVSKTWQPMLDTPLFDGERTGNSYPSDPTLGPDGCLHMVWVWRGTGDAATNHDLCHARSKDLLHWETAAGDPVGLPLTQRTPGVIVDPVPIFGGLLNIGYALGFDLDGMPVISYYKFDDQADTQVYVARPARERDGNPGSTWDIVTVSRWAGRYVPERVGYIAPPPRVSAVSALPDGNLRLDYRYDPSPDTSYAGTWILDHDSLAPRSEIPIMEDVPAGLDVPRSDLVNMAVNFRSDTGSSGSDRRRYLLRYEALPVPVSSPPPPGLLEVCLIST